MTDFVAAIVVAAVFTVLVNGRLRRYQESERSLLQLSLALHLLFSALLVPLMRGPLKGGDLLVYDELARALLDRFPRAPMDTLQVLGGLLVHSGDPLPVPDNGVAIGSSGSMIAFTTMGLAVTFQSLPAACVLVGGFSFIGKLRIYDVFRAEFAPALHRRIIAATMLVPTSIFWSAGLIKEAFGAIGLGLVFKELYAFYRRRATIGGVIAGLLGLCLIATSKGYLLVPLGLAAAASVLLARIRSQRLHFKLSRFKRLATIAMGIVVMFAAGRISSQYDPTNFAEAAARQQDAGAQISYAGSYYEVTSERSLRGQIAATPLAVITALFRPFIFEARNLQSAANGLETAFFTVLFFRALRRGRAGLRIIREQPILVFCSVFSLIMAVGVGLASTNLGTLSRYRMPMMPFLWVVVTVVVTVARATAASRKPTVAPPAKPPWPAEPHARPIP
jgi:hypothetical protein